MVFTSLVILQLRLLDVLRASGPKCWLIELYQFGVSWAGHLLVAGLSVCLAYLSQAQTHMDRQKQRTTTDDHKLACSICCFHLSLSAPCCCWYLARGWHRAGGHSHSYWIISTYFNCLGVGQVKHITASRLPWIWMCSITFATNHNLYLLAASSSSRLFATYVRLVTRTKQLSTSTHHSLTSKRSKINNQQINKSEINNQQSTCRIKSTINKSEKVTSALYCVSVKLPLYNVCHPRKQ